jgi:Glycosyl hydrolases family 32 N-terminal domain
MIRLLAAAALMVLAGCGRYSDFTLPALAGGNPQADYRWEARPDPVILREEAKDVLNPSVAAGRMLYSSWDGRTWRTALATSEDGIRWQKRGSVLESNPKTWEGAYSAANGAVLAVGPQFWYWYVAGPKERPSLGLARSDNARAWRKEPAPVLGPGPYMSWDERGVADPYVIRIGRWFYLYYLGQDRARRQRLGVARSNDGISWEKLRANPILELGGPGAFDENGLGEPAVWSAGGYYWMLYTGRDLTEYRRIGLARSTDGVHWQKLPLVLSGGQPWDSKVVCDPTVEVGPAEVRVWFGGGDVARPDENLNGQIGYGILRPVTE